MNSGSGAVERSARPSGRARIETLKLGVDHMKDSKGSDTFSKGHRDEF